MLLAIDIGNSNIVIGGIDGDDIRFEARIATDRIKTSDQYGVEIKNMLDLFSVSVEEVEDCIISSVVPPVFNAVCTGVIKLTGLNPMVVGPGIKTGLNIQMDDPASVGSDRIVIAVAALLEYAPPLLLVDLGTATTIEVVDQGNTYLGGRHHAGVRVSAEALSSRAAQPARHPAGPPQTAHRQEHRGVHAQRHHVWGRRHAGRDDRAHGGGAGQVHHRGGHRGHGPVCGPPVQTGDEGGEGPAAEGPERHLQEKQKINAKAAGTAGGLQAVEKV